MSIVRYTENYEPSLDGPGVIWISKTRLITTLGAQDFEASWIEINDDIKFMIYLFREDDFHPLIFIGDKEDDTWLQVLSAAKTVVERLIKNV